MSWLTDRTFWSDTLERTVSTAAQGALIGWGVDTLNAAADALPPLAAIGIGAASGAVMTLLKCVAAGGVRKDNRPAVGPSYEPRYAASGSRSSDSTANRGVGDPDVPLGRGDRRMPE